MEQTKKWVLASASPRRKELLSSLINEFEIIPSKEEENTPNATPEEVVKSLARQKAESVFSCLECKGKIVLGADTVVALDGEILGKPVDREDAFRMLSALSGREHEVYTGICIIFEKEGVKHTLLEADCTKVRFRKLSETFINEYIQSGSPMDKAGAYGIQDGNIAEGIEGSFSNVVGLPVELCEKMIKQVE